MIFNVSCHLKYAPAFPSTLIVNVHAQRNDSQRILEEHFSVEPPMKLEELTVKGSDNRFVRLETGQAKELAIQYRATVDCTYQTISGGIIEDVPVAELSSDAIPYLFPSRYCQSDKLGKLAWDLFGEIQKPYDKVVAIVEWINSNVEYCRGTTNSETSAYDTVTQRTGVCRDFAHLGIALCRALNIPARYFSGYAYQLDPPDFHACFEAFVGGRWLIFDPTHLAHLNGLVRIGTSRDAADAALANIFGSVRLLEIKVDCNVAPGQSFAPLSREQMTERGVALAPESDQTTRHVAASN
jgi:transglutaminase-like putative cysteine protease